MKIGIPKEIKKQEFRVSLIPKHVMMLIKDGHDIFVEKNAGKIAGFSNQDYIDVGANIVDNVWDCDMIVKVKEPTISNLKENQIIMSYLHIEKNQNPVLLNALLNKKCTSYAYEEIRDQWSERLVNLGFEAGLVGMYEGLRQFGEIKCIKKLKNLKSVWEIGLKKAYRNLLKFNLKNKFTVGVMGNGTVGFGVQEILRRCSATWILLDRKKTSNIESYLPEIDILVNAVVWTPGDKHIITKDKLSFMKNNSLIVDISCDESGAIESCKPTSWNNPCYTKKGIIHMCIDNLPSAIPRESTIHLSHMIFPYVREVANNNKLDTSMMTKDGEFIYTHKNTTRNQYQNELRLARDPLFNLL